MTSHLYSIEGRKRYLKKKTQVAQVKLKLLILKDSIEITEMADRFWKSMPSALKKPTLDELYRRLRDLDYTQVDERMAVMLNAILQLEEQGECRESATEAVLMVGYTNDGVSNQEQTRWLSWNVDGAIRGFDLARNPGLNNNTEYGAGEFPLPVRPSVRSTSQSTSKVLSMTRAQQTGEAYPDVSAMKRELERTQRERNKANLDRDKAVLERDQARRDQTYMEPPEILSLVSCDINILVICGNKGPHEETSKGISTIPSRDRTRCLQETPANPSKCDHDGWKRVGRVSRDNSRARESILEEDLAKNISMSLHNSFCLNRESKVKSLPNQSKRLQEQREWMRSYEQLKAWEEIVISSDDEEALLEQITGPRTPVSGTSKAKNTR